MSALSRTREDHRDMILSPDRWPYTVLPLKRSVEQGQEVGVLLPLTEQNYRVIQHMTIFGMPLADPVNLTYNSVEAILDDGWIVD